MNKLHNGLVPAIGGALLHIKNESSTSSLPTFELPPSPIIPSAIARPNFPPYVKTFETNPESLLPGVVDDLTAVTRAWGLESGTSANGHDPHLLGVVDARAKGRPSSSSFEVLSVLKTTTLAIRSIRNYVLSLPDDSTGTIREQFRSTRVASSSPLPKKPSQQALNKQSQNSDPLTLIRRAALEVLTSLRELEEKSRVPLSDDVYDAQSDHGSALSPSGHSMDLPVDSEVDADVSFSYIQVQGRYDSVPVWEDDNPSDSDEEKLEKRSHWDERLVLGGGWLYKQDVKLQYLAEEQDVVKHYLDVVDDVLFGGSKDGKRGWERERDKVAKKDKADLKGRRVSAGDGDSLATFQFPMPRGKMRRVVSTGILDMKDMSLTEEPEAMETLSESGEESVDDDELPEWAKRTTFADDPLGEFSFNCALKLILIPPQVEPMLCWRPTSPPLSCHHCHSQQIERSFYKASHQGSYSVSPTTQQYGAPASPGDTSVRTPSTTLWHSSTPLLWMKRKRRGSAVGHSGGRITCDSGRRKYHSLKPNMHTFLPNEAVPSNCAISCPSLPLPRRFGQLRWGLSHLGHPLPPHYHPCPASHPRQPNLPYSSTHRLSRGEKRGGRICLRW